MDEATETQILDQIETTACAFFMIKHKTGEFRILLKEIVQSDIT